METKKNSNGLILNTLFRIVCFMMYYVVLIAFGFFLFWQIYMLTTSLLQGVLDGSTNASVVIILWAAIPVIALWLIAVMFGLFLIKPIFSFFQKEAVKRLEVTRANCPELYDMIADVATRTSCRMPKHVYIYADVNAFVHFQTNFWSLFFPVKKTLALGLGLFQYTSIDEVKSIIAHEFGHFSQEGTRTGTTVYVANQVLHDLVFKEDAFDRMLNKWVNAPLSIWAYYGKVLYGLTMSVKYQTIRMYNFVQKSYLKLSRQQEFRADGIACRHLNASAFASALCKIEYIGAQYQYYEYVLTQLGKEGLCVGDFWAGFRIVSERMSQYDQIKLSSSDILNAPIHVATLPSAIEMIDDWATHPSLKDRIENARSIHTTSGEINKTPAWQVVTERIIKEVGDKQLLELKQQTAQTLTHISMSEFAQWVDRYMGKRWLPASLRPFFSRYVLRYQPDDEEDAADNSERLAAGTIPNPFTTPNRQTIMAYETALRDWAILNDILEGRIKVKELMYNGTRYTRATIPFKTHLEYGKQLRREAKRIDANIHDYLIEHADDKQQMEIAYTALFYAQELLHELEPIREQNNEVVELIEYSNKGEELTGLSTTMKNNELNLKKLFQAHVRVDLLGMIADEASINALATYIKGDHYFGRFNAYKAWSDALEQLEELHVQLHTHCTQTITWQAWSRTTEYQK